MPQIHRDSSYIEQIGRKRFRILKVVDIETPFKPIRVFPEYIFDKDSWVRNSPDYVPSLGHDWTHEYQVFADGTKMTRLQSDIIYYVLNMNSVEAYNRDVAERHFRGVQAFGRFGWYRLGRPKQIPMKWVHLYPALI